MVPRFRRDTSSPRRPPPRLRDDRVVSPPGKDARHHGIRARPDDRYHRARARPRGRARDRHRCGRSCGPAPAAQRRWATARGRSPSSRPTARPPSRASAWRWPCPTTRSRSRWPRRCRNRGCATCPAATATRPGLFQQRPSQGWGTLAQVTDPVYAATAFYAKLRTEPDWPTLSVTEAAQLVQRSATPEAYARWEPMARSLARALTGEDPAAMTCHEPHAERAGRGRRHGRRRRARHRAALRPAAARAGLGLRHLARGARRPARPGSPSPTTAARGRQTRARGATPGRPTACCRCAAPRARRLSGHDARSPRRITPNGRQRRPLMAHGGPIGAVVSRDDPIMVTG